ncbi:MAG: hypothetical protein ACPL7D_03915 [Candidatus Sumerlaeaceae bacterium]|jgi:hypothetical protein
MISRVNRFSRCLGLTLALVAAAGLASAKVVAPKIVPAKATSVVSIPDTKAMVDACQANPLAPMVQKIVAAAGGKDKLAVVSDLLPQIEKELGFPINSQSMAAMINGIDIFMTQNPDEDKPGGGVVAKLGEKDKFRRFLAYWEKAAIKAAKEAQSQDESSTSTEERAFITTDTIAGVLAKHFTAANGMDVYYAEIENYLLVATSKPLFAGMVERAKGKNASGGLDAATDFDKVEKALATHPGVLYMYQNPRAALASSTKKTDGLSKLAKLMEDLTPVAMSGSVVQVTPKSIHTYKYAPFAEGTENNLLRKLLERASNNGKIAVLDFAPEQCMLVGATNAFDAFFVYDILREAVQSLGGGTKEADLDKQLKDLEPILGFSVKDDLLPAMGKNVGFLVNALNISDIVSADAALVIEVRDKDKMQKVLTVAERQISDSLNKRMTPPADQAKTAAPAIAFKTVKEGDLSIRYLEILPLPTITPGYAMVGDYLIIATTKESIQRLVAVKAGKEKGLLSSSVIDQFDTVKPKGVSYGYMNFPAVWDTVQSAVGKMAGDNEEARKVIEALKTIKAGAGYAAVENGAMTGEAVLLLEPAR